MGLGVLFALGGALMIATDVGVLIGVGLVSVTVGSILLLFGFLLLLVGLATPEDAS